MYIKRIVINKLHGVYNYDIKLDEKLNLFFGSNGSGKTTILEIISMIIKGEIYKLYRYQFEDIKLVYQKKDKLSREKKIEIKRIDRLEYLSIMDKKNNKELNNSKLKYNYIYLDEGNLFEDIFLIKFNQDVHFLDKKSIRDLSRYYFSFEQDIKNKYEFLNEIQKEFNYSYLSLERNFYMKREDPFGISEEDEFKDILNSNFKDESMENVKKLVKQEILNISEENVKITDKFRDDVLKSLMDTSSNISIIDASEGIHQNLNDLILQVELAFKSEKEIKKIEKTYLSILRDLDIIDDGDILINSKKFFKNIQNTKNNIHKKNKTKDDMWRITIGINELNRIEKIVELAEVMEMKKNLVAGPLNTLTKTLNKFLNQKEDMSKIITIKNGEMVFGTRYSREYLSLENLSSGERQIVIFFTELILNIKSDRNGIYVADEPESSLHLDWQRIFIDEILKVNNNIQFIFATHSPELIGKYRDKMIRIEKTYVGDKNVNK